MALSNLDVFKVIADPSRREILGLLTKESYNINSLASKFDMSRPAVSKHIKILQNSGFISIKEIGRERRCVLCQDGFIELKTWIGYFDQFWNTKLKNLETVLSNSKKHKT